MNDDQKIFALLVDKLRYEEALDQTNLKVVEANDEVESINDEIDAIRDSEGVIAVASADLVHRAAVAYRKLRYWRREASRIARKVHETYEALEQAP